MTSILASGSGAEGPRLLADFPESLATLEWRVVNDDVMGGRSEGGFRLEKQWLVFEGTTNTRGGGFSSILGLMISDGRDGPFRLEVDWIQAYREP